MVQSILNCTRSSTFLPYFTRALIIRIYSISSINLNKNNDSSVSKTEIDSNKSGLNIPEAPTTCCMTGCSNCVWIEYAETLSSYFKDGGEKARKQILDSVTDSNMRAFLMMELNSINFKK